MSPRAGQSRFSRPVPRTARARRTQRILDRVRVVVGVFAILVGALGLTAPIATADPTDSGSAVTVHGSGNFSNLAITVSQTKNLTTQVVQVSWAGGVPTKPGAGSFYADYLQIMQCWGDPVKGPDRTQCEFGQSGDQRGGFWSNSRQVTYGTTFPADPNEPLQPANGVDASVPFDSVTGVQVPGDGRNQFFDSLTTNEIPYALTASDGTGQVLFETLAQPEAAGLGCGDQYYDQFMNVAPRPCFLVVVPRGETEIDGSVHPNPSTALTGLKSSPLEMTNWANRIVIPLGFAALPKVCPLQMNAKAVLGDEMIAKAMAQWGPALCTTTPNQFPYVPGTDDFARSQLSLSDPGMAIVGGAAPADTAAPAASQPVYAPLAVNGLAIAFYVTSQSRGSADPGTKVFDGRQLTQINLTPRLVLKLVSQSYKDGVSVFDPDFAAGGTMASNAFDLVTDPDFQKANPSIPGVTPDFSKLNIVSGIGDAIMPSESSDAIAALWQWINADPDAHAFLSGTPDQWGMVINPHFKQDLTLPRSDFPKSDPYCREFPAPQPKLCVQDMHPFSLTMDASAKAVAHGDDLASTIWDMTVIPARYQHDATQPPDKRALMAITDVATAAHYGLPTAKLMNGNKEFVSPNSSSMLASVYTMNSLTGAAEPDPASTAPGAYPLTTITYGATVPGALTKAEQTGYAQFLDLVASQAGQTVGAAPGQLALGYAPLPQLLRNQAETVAAQLRQLAGVPAGGSTSPPYSLPPGSSGGGTGGGNGGGGSAQLSVFVPPHTLPTTPNPGAVITPKPSPVATPEPPGPVTPITPLGWVRYVFLVLLIAGGALTLAGPLLRVWANKVPRRAIPSAVPLD